MAEKRKTGTVQKVTDQTARVRVDRVVKHPLYRKPYRVSRSFLVVVPAKFTLNTGDVVAIEETRPVSKRKSWRVSEIIETVSEAQQ